jgi:hypothetical protein
MEEVNFQSLETFETLDLLSLKSTLIPKRTIHLPALFRFTPTKTVTERLNAKRKSSTEPACSVLEVFIVGYYAKKQPDGSFEHFFYGQFCGPIEDNPEAVSFCN